MVQFFLKICAVNFKYFFLFFSVVVCSHNLIAQHNKTDFRSPIGIPIILSGNFGELRTNHFHTGLDIKTNGSINYRIYAVDSGYVSRIKVSHWGYGKAIYVDHPNGYTSVYAHLDHFPKKIEQILRKKQYENQTEQIDFTLNRDELLVNKGEVIAYSGNTGGSSGPHLHFELRETITEFPVNPQLYGIKVKDHTPPIIRSLKLYTLKSDSKQEIKEKRVQLIKTKENYVTQKSLPLKVNGSLGIGLSVIDKYDLAHNRCGIYSIKVWLDDKLIFSQKMDVLDFSYNKQINIHKDYKAFHEQKESVHKLYIHPENELPIYDRSLGDGIISLNDTIIHKIKIEAKDASGNKAQLNFEIMNEILFDKESGHKKNKIPKSNKLYINEENYTLFIDTNSFYNDYAIEHTMTNNNLNITPSNLPAKNKFVLAMKLNSNLYEDTSKFLIAFQDKNGKIKNRKGIYEDGWIKTKLNHLGNFSIMIDSIAPEIKAKKVNKLMTENQYLQFTIKDNLSGVEDYKVTINDKWVFSSYNYKNSVLTIPLDGYANLKKGEQKCVIEASDERMNKQILSYNFKYN